MSRTYRRNADWLYSAYGRLWTLDESWDDHGLNSRGWVLKHVINRRSRDKKPWDKPDKSFKQMKRRQERAQVRDAMSKGRELPRFRKSDQWDWT